MSQPLYFLPEVRVDDLLGPERQSLDRRVLARFGLDHLWNDVRWQDLTVNELHKPGPTGRAGSIVCANRPDGRAAATMAYHAGQHEWMPASGAADCAWIGIDPAAPPRAADLQRNRWHNGYWITVRGDRWLVPIIRRPKDGSTELPREMYWDAENRFVESVEQAYLRIWDATAEVIDWFLKPDGFSGPGFQAPRAISIAIDVMAVNYRYDRALHNRLRVIGSETWATVLGAAIDWPKFEAVIAAEHSIDEDALQKKTSSTPAPGQPSTSPGQEGG